VRVFAGLCVVQCFTDKGFILVFEPAGNQNPFLESRLGEIELESFTGRDQRVNAISASTRSAESFTIRLSSRSNIMATKSPI